MFTKCLLYSHSFAEFNVDFFNAVLVLLHNDQNEHQENEYA